MTEKDAVKCKEFVNTQHWYVRMQTQLDTHLEQHLCDRLEIVSQCYIDHCIQSPASL